MHKEVIERYKKEFGLQHLSDDEVIKRVLKQVEQKNKTKRRLIVVK